MGGPPTELKVHPWISAHEYRYIERGGESGTAGAVLKQKYSNVDLQMMQVQFTPLNKGIL